MVDTWAYMGNSLGLEYLPYTYMDPLGLLEAYCEGRVWSLFISIEETLNSSENAFSDQLNSKQTQLRYS